MLDIIFESDRNNNSYLDAIASGGHLITVVTPTYNRCHQLPHLYSCLKNQTSKKFVWLIINDGSIDQTDEVVGEMMKKEEIAIRYIQKTNGGKHSCIKLAIEETCTDYFVTCDDDDTYFPSMIDFFLRKWVEIEKTGRQDIGAIRALTQHANGNIVCGYEFDKKEIGKEFPATTLEMDYLLKKHQENVTCYKTKSLSVPDLFPSDFWLCERCTFVTESIWQGRFARMFKCWYVYIVLREYNETTVGLTRGNFSIQKQTNSFINCHMILNEHFDYLRYNKLLFVKYLILCGIFRISIGISLWEQIRHCKNKFLKVSLLCAYPFSSIMKYMWFRQKV